mmetsp:Transcript_32967/g.71346  ORF Transcript_32967/g.71346 Transcript_32967/m.71346 type:complete len:469 (-) Transcript_32967:29-1435(-)
MDRECTMIDDFLHDYSDDDGSDDDDDKWYVRKPRVGTFKGIGSNLDKGYDVLAAYNMSKVDNSASYSKEYLSELRGELDEIIAYTQSDRATKTDVIDMLQKFRNSFAPAEKAEKPFRHLPEAEYIVPGQAITRMPEVPRPLDDPSWCKHDLIENGNDCELKIIHEEDDWMDCTEVVHQNRENGSIFPTKAEVKQKYQPRVLELVEALGDCPPQYRLCAKLGGSGQKDEKRIRQNVTQNYSELFGVFCRQVGITKGCVAGYLNINLNDKTCNQSDMSKFERDWIDVCLEMLPDGTIPYNFAKGGGGGYAGLDDNCLPDGFSVYVILWYEYFPNNPFGDVSRRSGWMLNAKGITFGPKTEMLEASVGTDGKNDGAVEIQCPLRHPNPFPAESIQLVGDQDNPRYHFKHDVYTTNKGYIGCRMCRRKGIGDRKSDGGYMVRRFNVTRVISTTEENGRRMWCRGVGFQAQPN